MEEENLEEIKVDNFPVFFFLPTIGHCRRDTLFKLVMTQICKAPQRRFCAMTSEFIHEVMDSTRSSGDEFGLWLITPEK